MNYLGDKTSKEHSTEVPSSPHDYDSISEADIPMRQMGRDPVRVAENREDVDTSEEEEEEDGQQLELNIDIHPTPVNDATTDSTHQHNLDRGNYSSLKTIQNQTTAYIQLGVQVAVVAETRERNEENYIVPSKPHSYYNLP